MNDKLVSIELVKRRDNNLIELGSKYPMSKLHDRCKNKIFDHVEQGNRQLLYSYSNFTDYKRQKIWDLLNDAEVEADENRVGIIKISFPKKIKQHLRCRKNLRNQVELINKFIEINSPELEKFCEFSIVAINDGDVFAYIFVPMLSFHEGGYKKINRGLVTDKKILKFSNDWEKIINNPIIQQDPVILHKKQGCDNWVFFVNAREEIKFSPISSEVRGGLIDKKQELYMHKYIIRFINLSDYNYTTGDEAHGFEWIAQVLCSNYLDPKEKKTKVSFYINRNINNNHYDDLLSIPEKYRGLGLTNIIWRHFAHWLIKNYPEAKMKSLFLGSAEGNGLIARNRMYENAGFSLYFENKNKVIGDARCENVKQLNDFMDYRNFEVIQLQQIPHFLKNLESFDANDVPQKSTNTSLAFVKVKKFLVKLT